MLLYMLHIKWYINNKRMIRWWWTQAWLFAKLLINLNADYMCNINAVSKQKWLMGYQILWNF